MHEVMIHPPYCSPEEDDPLTSPTNGAGDCGSSFAAVIYFMSFTLLCALTTLNLIVAVILYAFFELSESSTNKS
jgi:hypothetical protein